jgi:hypothetical protein
MTYFLFSITNKCNKACPYCIVKDYVNNPMYPDKLDKEAVFSYFAKRAKAGDLAEITGGEPTLVGWLEEFVQYLDGMDIKIVLRTNGFRLFKNVYSNLVIAYNPHGGEPIAKDCLRETDIIIKPVITDSKMPEFKNDADSPFQSHPFNEMRFITADGNIRSMSCSENSIGNIWDANDTGCIYMACPHCPFILGAWNLANRLK